ncbi:hypothetical protein BS47DRAFT_1118068 [Hydnum rufescens UP504]|uniref:Uncharacterized protein n=1 Tax=Hydnum rufescens UP504 TaxID=1448309 RepID=A0A9P6ATY2_9AGAM|nr:hypothetical protein BS47DRAFT_1118068 [Hydnum rufescens UP504]
MLMLKWWPPPFSLGWQFHVSMTVLSFSTLKIVYSFKQVSINSCRGISTQLQMNRNTYAHPPENEKKPAALIDAIVSIHRFTLGNPTKELKSVKGRGLIYL